MCPQKKEYDNNDYIKKKRINITLIRRKWQKKDNKDILANSNKVTWDISENSELYDFQSYQKKEKRPRRTLEELVKGRCYGK